MGERALLVETGDTGCALALFERLQRDPLEHQVDVAPGASSVLIRFSEPIPSGAEMRARSEWLGTLLAPPDGAHARPDLGEITIDVAYDGPDLDEVAALTGLSRDGVVTAHSGAPWRVAFCGFAPGFGYLVGGDARLAVPRRDSPRAQVPAGSVGLAAEYSAVYPRESPGGWRLIGRTDAVLWDVRRDPPAMLRPGMVVRFRPARRQSVRLGAVATAGCADDWRGYPGAGLSGADARNAQDPGSRGPGRPEPGLAGAGATLTVTRPGIQCTVQDLGRCGWAQSGVGPSGAADRGALVRANRIVGNDVGAAALEIVLGRAEFRVGSDTVLAVTGAPVDVQIVMDGGPGGSTPSNGSGASAIMGMNRPIPVGAGTVVRIGRAARGLRSYLAVRGGIDLPVTLGSRSSDLLGGIGPDPLRAGDVLPIGCDHWGSPHPVPAPGTPDLLELEMNPGPQLSWFAPGSMVRLTAQGWSVSPSSNRVGVRLRARAHRAGAGSGGESGSPAAGGPAVERIVTGELPVQGLVRGAIQVVPSGELVIFLADHPVTGGYPVIAVLTESAADLAAQARPGTVVRLRGRSREP